MIKGKRTVLKYCSIVLAAFLLIFGSQVTDVSGSSFGDDCEDITIKCGEDRELTLPTALKGGEIWTGKDVVHNRDDEDEPDGTITVTLYAWGTSFTDENNELKKPLGGDGCVTVIDDLGEFKIKGSLPAGVVQDGDKVTWKVSQDDFLVAAKPVFVEYVLELKDPENVKMNYWYATGTALAKFVPAEGNPFYWTKEETVYNAFSMSMNWNNGKGLNSGTITDSILGVTISFGKNSSPEFEYAYGKIPLPDPLPYPGYKVDTYCGEHGSTHWDDNAVIQGHPEINKWHLEWNKTNDKKNYYFTVGGLGKLQPQMGGREIDIVYEVIFPTPGGNESKPGGRKLKSDDFFHRTFEENDPDKLFLWDGEEILVNLPVLGRIEFSDGLELTGSLTITKELEGWYNVDWAVNGETPFAAMVADEAGYYLTFEANEDSEIPNQYIFTGFAETSAIGSKLAFSERFPATIEGIPADTKCTVEEILEFSSDLITVSYSKKDVVIKYDEDSEVIVTNTYAHGLGQIEIWKLYDGFPSDWGISSSTLFYAKVWDVDNENYLLFKPVTEADGTYRCVGNDKTGLSEDYEGNPTTILSFSVGKSIKLSNLWTWGRYEVREVDKDGNDIPGKMSDYPEPSDYWKDYHWQVEYSANNGTHALVFHETMVVTVTNRYKHGVGNIAIYKELDGYKDDWGVNDDTVFYAKVADVADPRYPNHLWFKSEPEEDGSYRCVGNDLFGLSEPYDISKVLVEVPFSVNKPILLSNLWAEDSEYHITEISAPGKYDYKVEYSSNDFVVPIDGTQYVTVTNTFERGYSAEDGTGNMIIGKELDPEGFHSNYGIDETTVFKAKVWDENHENYLIFNSEQEADDGSYRCIGHLACLSPSCTNTPVDGVHYSETPGAPYITEVPFSVRNPAVLSNLWTVGHFYRVEEIAGKYAAYCTVTYSKPGGTVGNMETLPITVINKYAAGGSIDYTVTVQDSYAEDDGSGNYTRGETVTVAAGTRPGWRFTGWVVNSENVTLADPEDPTTTFTMPAEDVTVTATWARVIHKVIFDPKGGSDVDDQDVEDGGKVIKPADPQRNGYRFGGWYKDEDCTIPWDFDNDTVTEDTTIYAKWARVIHKVIFDPKGGSDVDDQDVEDGGKVIKPADPQRNGYRFGGWYKDEDCAIPWDFDNDTVTEDTTIYAKWTRNSGGNNNNSNNNNNNGNNSGNNDNVNNDNTNNNNIDGNGNNNGSVLPDIESGQEIVNRPVVELSPGTKPEDFPGIDFEAKQPDTGRPGGTKKEAPPVPNRAGNKLTPRINNDGDIIFVEFDEAGVPLGEWHWEDEEELWVFDEYPPPLSNIPRTGYGDAPIYLLALLGLSVILLSMVLRRQTKSRAS